MHTPCHRIQKKSSEAYGLVNKDKGKSNDRSSSAEKVLFSRHILNEGEDNFIVCVD